jgi:hypothetical protein
MGHVGAVGRRCRSGRLTGPQVKTGRCPDFASNSHNVLFAGVRRFLRTSGIRGDDTLAREVEHGGPDSVCMLLRNRLQPVAGVGRKATSLNAGT